MAGWHFKRTSLAIGPGAELRLRRAKRPRSLVLLSLLFLTGLLFLELMPPTGPLLARAGAAYVAGWLVQVCLLAVLVDAARGALPRLVAVLPLLAYGGYWCAVWEQGRRVEITSEALQNSNPGVVLAFDPDQHSVLTNNAEAFAVSHVIPIVYAPDPARPGGYLSYLVSARAAEGSFAKIGKRASVASTESSESAFATIPAGLLIESSISDHRGDIWKDWGIGERTTEVAAKGTRLGVFRSAYVDRLSPLPFVTIGCTYAGSASRQCGAGFVTERLSVESRPKSVDRGLYDDGLSVMLKIAKRSEKDALRTQDLKMAAGTGAPSEREAAEIAAFAELEGLLKGGDNELSSLVARTVASNPSRLEPFAPLLVSRFLELYRTKPPNAPGRQRNLSNLATMISALSPVAFSSVEDRLAPLLGELSAYPLLYLRMADLGAAAYPHYRDRIMANDAAETELILSVLAVCRLGFADAELISSLTSKINASGEAYEKAGLVSAIFLTMLKLGQEKIVEEFNPSEPAWLQTWRSQVLSGKGQTDVGPNNCMPADWPLDVEVPPVMAAGLVWSRGSWRPRSDLAAGRTGASNREPGPPRSAPESDPKSSDQARVSLVR